MSTPATQKKSWIDKALDGIERVCNKLPPPGILFIYLFVIVAVIGAIVSATGASLVNPANGETVVAKNFFTGEGIQWLLKNLLTNFTGFAPLGLVICMTLAIGFCEESGLIMALLQNSLKNIPPVLVPYVVAFVGTCGNIASDTAMVVIPPIAAVLYIAAGKHPVVGMICGYAGAQAGFSANLMIAGTDSLLQGITNNCIKAFLGENTTFQVDVTCNWFFMIASTFLCGAVIGWACNKFADPRFGKYEGDTSGAKLEDISAEEKKALNASGKRMEQKVDLHIPCSALIKIGASALAHRAGYPNHCATIHNIQRWKPLSHIALPDMRAPNIVTRSVPSHSGRVAK